MLTIGNRDILLVVVRSSGLDDEFRTQNRPSVHGNVWVASTSRVPDGFYLDSGATLHVTCQKELLHDFSDSSGSITGLDSGTLFEIAGKGTLNFLLPNGSFLTLTDVQYVPSCDRNLISISKATLHGALFRFLHDAVHESRLGFKVATLVGPEYDRLYKFLLSPKPASVPSGRILNATFSAHCRLGHPSANVESYVGKHNASYRKAGASKSTDSESMCEACARGKATHSLPKKSTTGSSPVRAPLELVHSDVCGPFSQPSLTDDRYFVVIVDDYTRYMTVYPIATKAAVPVCISEFILKAERFFHNRGGYRVVTLRSDNGGEYMSSRFDKYLADRGITHQTTVPYNSHQNGVSERAIRTLTEKARVMMFAANAPLCLWAEAISCAAFLINRLPSRSINNGIPYKRWNKRLPVLDGLRPFGCLAYAYIPESVRSSKLSPRSIRGIMVGYAPTQHAYRIFDLDSGTVVVSNNVKFDEFAFPFQSAEKVPRNFSESKPSASSVSSFFSAPGVLATLELPDTAMDVDQADLDTLMTESTPMSMLDTSIHELSPADKGLNSDETDVVPALDIEMTDSAMVPSLDIEMSDPVLPSPALLKQIAHLDNQSSSNAITDCPSESCRQINVGLSESSSPVSSPAVVEPSSPPVVSKTNPRPLIEYISDSEASLSGEDYKISYYEHHHDNFDFSDDKDYVENPVRKRKAITEKLRRRSEISSEDETEPSKKQKHEDLHESSSINSDTSLVVRGSAYFMSHAYVVSTKKDGVPITYKQAMLSAECEKWKIAMDSEMSAHYSNNTWDLVLLPKDRKAIGNRWVFTKKDDGRYKARLVAQGFSQVPGEDYLATFSPVIRYESVKLLLAFSAVDQRVIHHVEVFCLGTSTSNIGCSLCIVLHMYWQIYLVLK